MTIPKFKRAWEKTLMNSEIFIDSFDNILKGLTDTLIIYKVML
jgi:hypothetical protein